MLKYKMSINNIEKEHKNTQMIDYYLGSQTVIINLVNNSTYTIKAYHISS